MPQESFVKKLLDRRVPHILGSYLVAIHYTESHPDEYTEGEISYYHTLYDKWSNFNGHADMTLGEIFGYSLKVVEVTESKVVAKLLELKNPWVKIREGDKITP